MPHFQYTMLMYLTLKTAIDFKKNTMKTFYIIIKLPFVDYMKIVNKQKYL
jgi:hypothetical protein